MAAILSTSFAAPVTDWAATWPLASVTGVQIGHLCVAESELAQVMKVGPATTVTVRRGVEGTASAAHAARTPVAVYRGSEVPGAAAPAGPIPLRQVTTTLTHAQITTLPTTPLVVVPAPGPQRVALVVQVVVRVVLVGVYTNITNAGWYLCYDYTGAQASTLDRMNVLGLVGEFLRFGAGTPQFDAIGVSGASSALGGGQALLPDTANQTILLRDDWASGGAYTGGHAANTATISVSYAILDLTTGVFV